MKIGLIQQHASDDLDENLRRGVEAFREAAGKGAELIAFAELAFLPFLPRVPAENRPGYGSRAQAVPGPVTEEFSALARRCGVVTVLNLFEVDGGRTFDSSPVIDADGRLLGTTRMVHIMDGPGFHERGYYAPGGEQRFVFDTAVGRVGVAICYDRHFPELKDGGRGYLRNISLVNVWATAPFMHNNAIGPEICGKPANKDNDFHRARYVDGDGKLLASQPDCLRYDPTVDGRFDLYKRSMHELLHPKDRGSKRTLTNADLIIDVGIRPLEGKTEKPLGGFGQVRIAEGASAGFLNGLQHKQLVGDLFLAKRDPAKLEAAGKKDLVPTLQAMADEVLKHPARFVDILREQRGFLSANYETCTEEIENGGHRFGEDLSAADKKALTAFLATL